MLKSGEKFTIKIEDIKAHAKVWWDVVAGGSHFEYSCKFVPDEEANLLKMEVLKKKLTDKYCPKGEVKKLQIKQWNLKGKGKDVVNKYISGLPDNIHGDVMSARPKTLDDAIELASDLMDQKLRTYAKR
nr:hypothetical protein [Tanacetum cinerariifolium]